MSEYNGLIAAPIDVAAVTAAEAINSSTELDFLFDDRPRRLVESTTTSLTLDIDLGEARDVNLIAPLFTNAASDATWSVRFAADQNGLDGAAYTVPLGTTLWASPSGEKYTRRHGFAFFPTVNARWVRVALVGGTISGGRLRCGRLMISKALQPGWNYSLGSSQTRRPLIDENRSRSGQLTRRVWQKRRVLSLRFPELTEDELFGELEPIAEVADERAILLIQEPADAAKYRMEKMYYGNLVVASDKTAPNEFATRLTLTELT